MKKLLIAITVISALTFLSTSALAGPQDSYDIIVTGQGNFPEDVGAVQEAVDEGGKILLRGTFNFGTDGNSGSVEITRDVQIFGETDKKGELLTIIEGGHLTFYSPHPVPVPDPLPPGPQITIRGIRFIGAIQTPILLKYCSGAKIMKNKIEDVIPVDLPSTEYKICYGVDIDARHDGSYLPGAVTGNIDVMGNEIDMDTDNPEIVFGVGVFLLYSTGVTANVSRNIVRNASRSGLQTLNNYVGEDSAGIIFLEDNEIITPSEGAPYPSPTRPNGIAAGRYFPGPDIPEVRYVIAKNYIEMHGAVSSSHGIATLADDIIVKGNRIVVDGNGLGRGIRLLSSGCLVTQNKIEGNGFAAIFVTPYFGNPATDNLLLWNNIDNFDARPDLIHWSADVVFLTGGNTLVGGSGTVRNMGLFSNTIKGDYNTTTTPGGVGDEISDAMTP